MLPMHASLADIEAIYRSRGADFFRLALARTGEVQAARDAVQEGHEPVTAESQGMGVARQRRHARRVLDLDSPHVHDIAYLTKLLRETGVSFGADERDLRLLSQSAVVFRYPGENATAEDANEVMAICMRLRDALLKLIDASKA